MPTKKDYSDWKKEEGKVEDKKDTKMEFISGVGIIAVAVLFALYLIGVAVEHPGENGVLTFLLFVGGGTICCLFLFGSDIIGKAYKINKVKDKEKDTVSVKEATAITVPTASEEETEEETTPVTAEDDTEEKEENK